MTEICQNPITTTLDVSKHDSTTKRVESTDDPKSTKQHRKII